ncbi:hypothetical protein [Pedobacter suwonensis]|uniref:hypothetical protein n=1 Tax=Pedobacter suwonensis TaxID=332999 RepID=UPI003CFF725C
MAKRSFGYAQDNGSAGETPLKLPKFPCARPPEALEETAHLNPIAAENPQRSEDLEQIAGTCIYSTTSPCFAKKKNKPENSNHGYSS